MKSLLCALNTKYVHSSLAPWYLKAMADKLFPCSSCKIFEGTINESENELLKRILENEFDIIGFSTYIWNVKLVLSLCEKIKKKTGAKILLGGPEVSYNAKNVLAENSFIDYVISGDGEIPFAKLCGDELPENIQGLCYRNGTEIVIKEPYIMNEDPPCPYTQEYFDALKGRIAYIETSRGCPYRCAFCLSGRCGGVRFFDIEQSKKNIVALSNSGAKTIKFIDRTFNADRKRSKDLFEFIINSYGTIIPYGVCFHFEIEGDILDDETIEILAKAKPGAIQMEIGLQSFNKETLKAINRKTELSRLCENVRKLLLPQNIHIHIDLIAGLPYETLESFEDSFNKAISLRPHMLQLGFLKLLYGSSLREENYECVYDFTPPYEVKSTPWISSNELETLHITEDFFDRFYNSGRFNRTIKYTLDVLENPFKSYTELAVFVKDNEKTRTLDEFSRLLFEFLSKKEKIDKKLLRDYMAMDRLASNRMGVLPEFLKIHSPRLKEFLNKLEESDETKKKNGIKRAITLLESENSFVYVDYDNKNPVNGEYKIFKLHNFT